MSLDLTTQYAQENADLIADLEHHSHRAKLLLREWDELCQRLSCIDLPDGRTLLETDEAQDAVRIVFNHVEEWVK